MALANFFAKSALSVAEIIQGASLDFLAKRLDSQIVGIAFDSEAAESPEGRCTLSLLVNLLARFYPRLAIVDLSGRGGEFARALGSHAAGINPNIEIQAGPDGVTVMVVVGATRAIAPAVFYTGSDGWIAKFAVSGPAGCGRSALGFGAGMAACIGAANVFRAIFRNELASDTDDDLVISLIDLVPNGRPVLNPATQVVDCGPMHLVGAGAIGNAAIWALRNSPAIRGTIVIVDPEPVELSNLQRYCLTEQGSVGAFKVDVAAAALEGSSFKSEPHRKRWSAYLFERNDWLIDRVAVGVDSAEDRCSVQAALPARAFNAWTQPGDFGISRHLAFGQDACLACLYLPDHVDKNEDELIAEAIRLPQRKMQVRQLLHTGEAVSCELLSAMAAAMGVSEKEFECFRGCSMRDFYARAICGGVVLRLGGQIGSVPAQAHVPMAFQSVAAGIVLAAEVVIDAGKLRTEPRPASTRINLLRPLGGELGVPVARDATGRCLCADADYLAAYNQKYTS